MLCRIVRAHNGAVRGYVRVPQYHELCGERDLAQLSLVLDVPGGITYSQGGQHGWWIAFPELPDGSWDTAVRYCESLARQLAAFESTQTIAPPAPGPDDEDRQSGEREAPGRYSFVYGRTA